MTTSERLPCPSCGSEAAPGDQRCSMCGLELQDIGSNSGVGRCARCGATIPGAHDFCPVCGLDQRTRLQRPATSGYHMPVAGGAGAGAEAAAAAPAAGRERELASVAPAAVPHPGAAVRLVLVQRDGSDGEAFPFVADRIEIGRSRGQVLFPRDPFVSPAHARVEREGSGFALVDLDSRNGVYLRIGRPEPVYPADLILVGRQLLRLDSEVRTAPLLGPDAEGTRVFGTPVEPAWGRLVLVGLGGFEAAEFLLRTEAVTLGRESGDIVFHDDAFMSRKHARIVRQLRPDGAAVVLEDLGSANGTYLRVRQRAPLRPGDAFRVGDQILRVRIG